MKGTYYFGLDVHNESVAIAYAIGNRSLERALRKLAATFGVRLRRIFSHPWQ